MCVISISFLLGFKYIMAYTDRYITYQYLMDMFLVTYSDLQILKCATYADYHFIVRTTF